MESNKRYLITITEAATEESLTDKEWVTLRSVGDASERGYTPQESVIKKVQREIYKQNTDDLDLVSVIKAINNINA